jgi:hypothetical protein
MKHSGQLKKFAIGLACVVVVIGASFKARASSEDRTSLVIVVKDADSDDPIGQARLTLTFREPGNKFRLKPSKKISYSAKTNGQGKYRFTNIPKGTIRVLVTAERHQSYGKELDLDQDNQVFEVKLRKPQPLL